MAVIIGSARIDEHNKATGGKYGDQTGWEVATEDWYPHSKGWVVLRAKNPDKREWLAVAMEQACANDLIGYDQDYRNSLYNAARDVGFCPAKVSKACDCDCSSLVRVCCLYAEINCPDFYTGNEVAVLELTDQFEKLTDAKYTESPDYLMRGDILVTKTQGHTAIVLTDGAKVHRDDEDTTDFEVAAYVLTEHYDGFIAYLAEHAVNGDYGNGETRKKKLGGLYEDVRNKINEWYGD